MSLATEYTATAAARLRFLVDAASQVDPDEPTAAEQVQILTEQAHEDAEKYAKDLVREHELEVEHWQETVEPDEEGEPAWPPPPDLLADEIASVSSTIAELETYRRRLLAFADGFAVDGYSQRVLARVAGVNHATISRWLTDAQVREQVRAQVQPVATELAEQVDVATLTSRPDGPRTAAVLARLVQVAAADARPSRPTTRPTDDVDPFLPEDEEQEDSHVE